MQNTTANYKLEINKPSREFECKITIGNNIYNNDELVNLTLEHTQPQEGFSIGDTISQSLDLTLLNRGDIIYSTSQIKVEIGLKIGSTIEYILIGIFNIDDIEKTDYTTKFTAYDNMIKFETPYFSSLGDKPTLKQVVNELSKITGIEFIGSLPNYTVSKLEGFTCREVLSYVASICGGNAVITRDGKFTIKSLSEIKKSIDGNNYFDYKREEVKYKIGKISCQIDENNILYKGSTGTDSMELGFENPWVTETILNDLYNKLNGLSYLGYSMKWQGDLSLDPYDIVTVTDIKNVIRKIPILSQKISYTGGLTSEIGAKGETKNKNSFSSSGSIVNKVNRAIIEQAIIKEALIEKANIKDVEAVSIRTQILEAKTAKIEEAIIDVAHISDLNAINANIQNLIANDVKINNALINKADITELNAVVGNINIINSELANIKTLVNGNLSSENIQAGGITSDKLTIANGFITNAMIANLDVSKINAGNISTNKFRIVSDNGGIEIVGATQQFKDKNNKVRIQMGQDAKGNFNFILRGEDGTTTLIDHTGIKEKAIADNLIKGNMVATDAIGEKQINYSSLVIGLNKDTNTQLIKASKVAIDFVGQSLEVAFNSLKNQADNAKLLIENHSTTIGVMQGQINTAINNTQIVKDGKTILLKDDYNRTVSKVDSINSTIGTHTTRINELTGNITSVDTKVNSVQRDLEGTKSTVSSHTNLIDGLNSKVSTQKSSIEQLKNQITLKVNSTELTTMKNELIGKIDSIEIGGRNLLLNSGVEVTNNNYDTNTYIPSELFVEGETYTVTLCVTPAENVQSFRPYLSSGMAPQCILSVNGTSKQIISATFKANYYSSNIPTKPTDGHALMCFYRFPNNGTVTSNSTIHWVKVEKGNKATDFTLAPEDIDSVIGTKANKTDVYVKSEVYTKSQTDSAINIAKDSINLGISETYETKSNVETKVNSAVSTSKNYADTKKTEAITQAGKDADSKVASAKTELNSKIDLKASKTDVYTKSETYTKAETDSAIKVAKDSIELGVKNTYETKTDVENKITNAVNSIQLGGRNLFLKSNIDQYGLGNWIGNGGGIGKVEGTFIDGTKTIKVTGYSGIQYNSFIKLKRNTTYVYSMMMKSSGSMIVNSSNPLHMWLNTSETGGQHLEKVISASGNLEANKWTKVWVVFETPNTQDVYYMKPFVYGINTNTVYISKVQIEEGTKCTDWTPAPEDIDSVIDSKANKTDVYTKSEVYTKVQTDSAINVAKDSINLSVSGTYETKTNVESKINTAKANAINSAKSYTDGQITTVNKTITNKVSEIKATTDSISQKVSTTESKITTINNNISGLTNRVSTAESKLTATSLTTTISSAISGGTSSISTTQFVMDKNGLTIKNGGLTIQNKAGTTVLNSDTNGNLIFTGTAKSQSGARWVGLDSGGITFQDSQKNEQMLRIAISYFNENRDINGVNLSLAKYGDYIRISHIDKADLTTGWSSSNTQYNFMDFWSSDQIVDGVAYKKGINVYAPMYINKRLKLYSGTNFLSEIDGAISWNNGTGTINNLLGMYGDNGAVLGYKSGESFNARFLVSEASHPGTGDNLISWGNYNFNGWTFHNANIVAKSLSVNGSKNCLQETKNYGSRLINAYETAEYYFGDLGFGRINEDGECYLEIDDIFLECVNTNLAYHVFTQIYNGKITSIERYRTYFIVKGEPGTSFSWELKAKRKGYEINRLDLPDIETQGDEIDIFIFENEIETDEEDLMKELTFELENLLLKEHEEDE